MQISYPINKCHKQGHEYQQYSYYCIEDGCQHDRMLCVLCAYEISESKFNHLHSKHQIKPIKYLLHQISKDCQAVTNSLIYLAKIDELKLKVLEQVKCHKIVEQKQIANILDLALKQYFDRIDHQCNITYILKNKQKITDHKIFSQFLYSYYKYWIKYYDQDKPDQPIYLIMLNSLIEDLSDKIKAIKQFIEKQDISISLVQLFKLQSSGKKFYFSPKMMHSGLSFVDKTKIKIDGYADYNYYALCQPAISTNKIQRITFKLTNLSSYVTLGLCNKNKVQGNYQFMSDGVGHGSYQISYDGYLWSDHDSSVNSTYSGWYFNSGDTVTVQVNPKNKQISFIRNNDQGNKKTMTYQVSKHDKLHFCVTMNSEPEQVDILE